MNITFACPKCERPTRAEVDPAEDTFACPGCGATIEITSSAFADGCLERCLTCRSRDVYIRKDFPQRLGVLIVVLGFAASCVTWAYSRPILTYAILLATALVDLALYLLMPNSIMCYHCGAQYRGLPHSDRYEGFDLEVHEKHRQQKIRLAEHQAEARAAQHDGMD